MPSEADFASRGVILSIAGEEVSFNPANTNYELHLRAPGRFDAKPAQRLDILVRADARKVWTVPSGGNFVQPIFGPPRIVQGRIKFLSESVMVVQAGAHFIVKLPAADNAYDLVNGPLEVGRLVNATVLPGAYFELAPVKVGA